MALDPVLPISGDTGSPVAVSAQQWRRLDVATTMAHDLSDVAARAGVCAGLAATVVGTSVTIGAGSAIITPTSGANGSYRVSVPGPESLTLTARDATYTRHDLVVVRVYDGDADASGLWEARLEVITGTPSASPAAPALPAGALQLWTVVVPPGTGTVTVVDNRAWTSALGGVITCKSTSRPDGAGLRVGQIIYETDTARLYAWDGANWRQYRLMSDTGWITPPTFWNGCAALDGLATRVQDGVVYMRGRLSCPAGMRSKNAFQVPVGHRPASNLTFASASGAAGYVTNWTMGANGILVCLYQETSSQQYVPLSGISWPLG